MFIENVLPGAVKCNFSMKDLMKLEKRLASLDWGKIKWRSVKFQNVKWVNACEPDESDCVDMSKKDWDEVYKQARKERWTKRDWKKKGDLFFSTLDNLNLKAFVDYIEATQPHVFTTNHFDGILWDKIEWSLVEWEKVEWVNDCTNRFDRDCMYVAGGSARKWRMYIKRKLQRYSRLDWRDWFASFSPQNRKAFVSYIKKNQPEAFQEEQ